MVDATRYFVLADYEVHDPHPLRLSAGTCVQLLKPDGSWPGWVWVESAGQRGWLPETFLEMQGGGECVCQREFDGTELSAARGEQLLALETVSGWIYAQSLATGRRGWFPLFNLRPVAEPGH